MEMIAVLTNLNNSEVLAECPVLQQNGSTMRLKLSRQLGIGSAVKLETGDSLLLGEVSYCQTDGESYVVWVELSQALHNVTDLSRLARALLG